MTDTNTTWIVVGLAVLALAIAVGVSLAVMRRAARQRTATLRERFGPEYNRAIQQYGGKKGERVLAARAERVAKIEFRELSEADRGRFTSTWTTIQQQFVDDPRAAVARANELIKEVMRARGYSADTGFEQRAADLSVDHPDVVQHYRAARALAQAGTDQTMNTEELRQAVVHYRALFADLLQPAAERTAPAAPGVLRPSHA
ncbi:MAG: hypothetical protein K0S65_2354 [Labilithrix sp.]|nr:hypothetical protein [Labilithrix sp.]